MANYEHLSVMHFFAMSLRSLRTRGSEEEGFPQNTPYLFAAGQIPTQQLQDKFLCFEQRAVSLNLANGR